MRSGKMRHRAYFKGFGAGTNDLGFNSKSSSEVVDRRCEVLSLKAQEKYRQHTDIEQVDIVIRVRHDSLTEQIDHHMHFALYGQSYKVVSAINDRLQGKEIAIMGRKHGR
ncbi:MAG: head-tail adaptor protein [Pseudomonadota bacterium]|nr:head-tail adaptor protein [Pseudomonadota bacterium]